LIAAWFMPKPGRKWALLDAACALVAILQKIVALIGEYEELREKRRRLPEGSYDKDLRDNGGKLHRVLSSQPFL
jgi:hypothetical protein